jgi:uncharacterized protein YraI
MKNALIAALGLALVPAAALAAVSGSVSADLNLRQGPSTDRAIITTIPKGAPVVIENCLEGLNWCRVSYAGRTGYAAARYLLADAGGEAVVVTQNPSLVDVVTAPVEVVGEAAGAVIGALGAAVTGVADAITPEPRVVTYVRTNPVEPVYLEGDVAVGATVPEMVTLREVPEYEYRYAYINDTPVLVDPATRRIVYVYG